LTVFLKLIISRCFTITCARTSAFLSRRILSARCLRFVAIEMKRNSYNRKRHGVSKFRVLIIDDDRDFLNDLSLLLAPFFQILTSSSSRAGMSRLVRKKPDCLLLDINMKQFFAHDPSLEGLAFLKEMRDNPSYSEVSATPVILISSSSSHTRPNNVAEYGANAFFPKPLDIDKLVDKIMELCNGTN